MCAKKKKGRGDKLCAEYMNVLKNEPKCSGHKLKNKLLIVVTSGN